MHKRFLQRVGLAILAFVLGLAPACGSSRQRIKGYKKYERSVSKVPVVTGTLMTVGSVPVAGAGISCLIAAGCIPLFALPAAGLLVMSGILGVAGVKRIVDYSQDKKDAQFEAQETYRLVKLGKAFERMGYQQVDRPMDTVVTPLPVEAEVAQ